ncbi:FixH family protein [Tahibacter caeni]|uniref:FixH family protein n=1 Tax=Tahibacter caeni TaxID=1453545 RepID=UPI002149470A|nr:FixH family protein [Tahibacter caeni]
MTNDSRARRAWREPLFWLVAGLPALGVVAGVGVVVAAVRSGGSDALTADVRRTAQIQVEDTRADEEALRRGLSARLVFDADGGIDLQLRGADDADALHLRLLHPARAEFDRQTTLRRDADGRWHARLDGLAGHAWTVRLESADHAWRLAGRLPAGVRETELAPLWQK